MIGVIRYKEEEKDRILERKQAAGEEAAAVAREIVREVRLRGDAAVCEYTAKFDGYAPKGSFEVTKEEIDAAAKRVDPALKGAMERAAENIRAFHVRQVRTGFTVEKDGVLVGQRVSSIARAGIYVPGGTAAYPSTVLMNAIPAKIAGVKEIVMVTPPGKTGEIKPEILAAAKIAGVDRVFRIGGAQAVAALAYGTETVPKVDKITGPGNVFVAAAKREVFGACGIDMIAGPSEILIIADEGANPSWMAADMLSQAEHDRLATAVLLTDSPSLARAVDEELDRRLALLPRREIAEASLRSNGKIIVTDSLLRAAEVSDELAPEHLELAVSDPMSLFSHIHNAGSVFLGYRTPEPIGDYYAGANHTLPTNGTAKFSSPLGVEDFIKTTQFVRYDEASLAAASDDVIAFAESEGLSAHARSISARTKE